MYKLMMLALLVVAVVLPVPETVPGNPKCPDIGLPAGLKAEDGSGTYSSGAWIATFTITTTAGFESNVPVAAVIVKAGPYANIYRFEMPVLSMSGFDGPYWYDISHVELCPPPSTAVDITDFGVRVEDDALVVYWESGSELDVVLYEVLKDNAVLIGVPPLFPGEVLGASYTVTDSVSSAAYVLRCTEISGEQTLFGPVSVAPSANMVVEMTSNGISLLSIVVFFLVIIYVIREKGRAK